ncbi:MAG: alpha/beta hydrolase [Chloroflexi bacterium]|nr:alpha/beta hydrolase [Chloroflexota bacterium]
MKMLKSKTSKWGIIALLVTALTAVLISYFRGRGETAVTVPDGAQAGDLILKPCPFETKSGTYDADCGTLVMPENLEKADSRLIALPVIRIRATEEPVGEPIFLLQGGPGGTNIWKNPPADLFRNHDFVMVGYRGVDGSSVLNCPEVDAALKGVDGNLLNEASMDNMREAGGRCAERLQSEGVDLDGYSMMEVIADLEAARIGFGYEKINLHSESYGTRLAQIYAWKHPESLHRAVLIGVNPPGHFVWEPEMVDAQLAHYADLCAQDEYCNGRSANLIETIRRVTNNMPKRWLIFPIDPGVIKIFTMNMLYNRGPAATLIDAYQAADQGDASGLALITLMNKISAQGGVWGDMFAKGGTDYDPSRDYRTEMNPPDSIIGSPMSQLVMQPDIWPFKPIPAEFSQVQPTDVEMLLISGNIDFSTPAEYATNELLPHLSNGTQVILKEVGHVGDVYSVQPEATMRLLTSFYDTGVADDSLFTYAPMDFQPQASFPKMAKIGLGVVVLGIPLLLLGGWWLIRRIRKGNIQ